MTRDGTADPLALARPARSPLIGAAIALLGAHARLDVIAAATDLPVDHVAAVVGSLQRQDRLTDALPVSHATPTARREHLESVSAAQRALLHRAIATELRRRGAPDEDVCEHLLQAPGDGDLASVEALRRQAAACLQAGRSDDAVSLLQRALQEPPPEQRLADVLVDLSTALLDQRQPGAALDAAQRARAHARTLAQRSAAAAHAYHALVAAGAIEQALGDLVNDIEQFERDDPDRALELEGVLLSQAPVHVRIHEVGRQRFAGRCVDTTLPSAGSYLLAVGQIFAMGGQTSAAEAADLTIRALALGRIGADRDVSPVLRSVWLLVRAEEHDAAAAELERMRSRAPELRDHPALAAFDGLIALRTGSVRDAIAQLDDAVRCAHLRGDDFAHRAAAAFLGLALHEADERDRLERLVGQHADRLGTPDETWAALLLVVRGRHNVQSGRPADGLDDLMTVDRIKNRLGFTNPAGWRQAEYAVEALVALGRIREAIALAELNLRRARSWGSPRAVALARRALARCRPPARAATLLADAIGALGREEHRLPRAELALDLGAALLAAHRRRDGERALRQALDDATRVDALRIARQADAALRGLGRRPRRPYATGIESLTPAELRVARLAAAGHQNKEIGALLHISVRTVENQLRHVYQKLGTRRAGLAEQFAGGSGTQG